MTRAETNKEKHVRGGWTWEACRKQADFHAESEERLDLDTVLFEWPDGSISIFSETSKDIHVAKDINVAKDIHTANGSTKMVKTVTVTPHKKEEELTLVCGDIYTMNGSAYILGVLGVLHTLININTGCFFTTEKEKKKLLYEMRENGAKQFQGKIVIEVN